MTFPVHCTACGFLLPSVDAGPCPQCGSTAKTVSMAGTALGQSTARGMMEAVIVGSVGEFTSGCKRTKAGNPLAIAARAPFGQILYGMLLLAILAMAFGYNVEYCPKIVVDGVEMSYCMKLTKPTPHQ